MSDQKSSPDWLPVGWKTELKVRKSGKKDKYYTDPVSGSVFRSLKDIHRYLKTGELGTLASKPMDKVHMNVELEEDKLSSHAVAEGQKLADSGTNTQITGNHSSTLVEVVKDEEILESTCTTESTCLAEHASDQCGEGAAVNGNDLPEAKGLEQREAKSESTIPTFVSAPASEASTERLLLENEVEKHGNNWLGKKRSNEKVKTLPRRASKRLAGIEIDPVPELKTNNRTRRVAAKRSGEATAENLGNSVNLVAPEEHAEKLEKENTVNKEQHLPIVLPPANIPLPEEHTGQVGTNNMADVKPESPLNLSLPDLWTDPCIEFAIKTLTGAIPVGNENKAEDNPGSPLDLPLGGLWTDPCIEFAVKTLTGAIPVADDLSVQDYYQQHVSSSETQGMTLPNVGLDNLCVTDLSSQHFNIAEKPLYKQQDLAVPVLPQTENVSLQNSGDSGLHKHAEGRSGECPRPSVI